MSFKPRLHVAGETRIRPHIAVVSCCAESGPAIPGRLRHQARMSVTSTSSARWAPSTPCSMSTAGSNDGNCRVDLITEPARAARRISTSCWSIARDIDAGGSGDKCEATLPHALVSRPPSLCCRGQADARPRPTDVSIACAFAHDSVSEHEQCTELSTKSPQLRVTRP